MSRTLRAEVSVCPAQAGPGLVKVVMRRGDGRIVRTLNRRLRRGDASPAISRAILLALWEARRLGARSLVLYTDDAEATSVLTGSEPPPPGALGPYLQVRALRHAFRSVEVRHPSSACADLPLWTAASQAA